jgi:hypothetical protein
MTSLMAMRWFAAMQHPFPQCVIKSRPIIVSALIVLPQIVVAAMATWVGRQANDWGRRPLLLIGFGALPIRALLFALMPEPQALLALGKSRMTRPTFVESDSRSRIPSPRML